MRELLALDKPPDAVFCFNDLLALGALRALHEARVAVPDDVAVGDLLCIPATGAYTYSMASNYNLLLRPAVVFVRDGAARVVVRRETLDDLAWTGVPRDGFLAWCEDVGVSGLRDRPHRWQV